MAAKKGTRNRPQRGKAYKVQVWAEERRPLRLFVKTIGNLNPFDEVTVSGEVNGILKDFLVDEGTRVSKGMLLAKINDRDYNPEVKRAEAAAVAFSRRWSQRNPAG